MRRMTGNVASDDDLKQNKWGKNYGWGEGDKRGIDCIPEEMLRWFGEKVANQRQHTIVVYGGQKKKKMKVYKLKNRVQEGRETQQRTLNLKIKERAGYKKRQQIP